VRPNQPRTATAKGTDTKAPNSWQLHELFTYLSHRGISTVVTVTQSGMVGRMETPVDTPYLADNVILFRYFEDRGRVRRAISVFKKRSGAHELTIRELRLGASGLDIGEPLHEFQGVLTGVPTFIGQGNAAPAANRNHPSTFGGDAHGR